MLSMASRAKSYFRHWHVLVLQKGIRGGVPYISEDATKQAINI